VSDCRPIVIFSKDWKIPPVSGAAPNGPCMEASEFTTETAYISCGMPATVRVHDGRAAGGAGRDYDMCAACADHNVRHRGMREVCRL
jgi:hypothetical protein